MSKLLVLSLLVAVASAQLSPTNTIVQNALQVPALSTLVSVLSLPAYNDILNLLNSPGNFTVFAPTNDAFAKAGVDPSEVDLVRDVLFYHVIPAVVYSTDLKSLQFAPSSLKDPTVVLLNGSPQVLEVTKTEHGVQIVFGVPGDKATTATVTIADVVCSNGVVHVVDTVLIFPSPPSVVALGAGLTALINAVVSVNLQGVVDNTSSVTIFAPTNEAFQKVGPVPPATLASVLAYHIVPAVAYSTDLKSGDSFQTLQGAKVKITFGADGTVFVNNAKVLVANVLTANGVVHVIDSVLLPPTYL